MTSKWFANGTLASRFASLTDKQKWLLIGSNLVKDASAAWAPPSPFEEKHGPGHIKNGAKKVIVSAPCKDADKTIVYGVNENILQKKIKLFLLPLVQLTVLRLLLMF